jgi:hypothetical protein
MKRDFDLSWLVYEEDDDVELAYEKGDPRVWAPIGSLSVVRGMWNVGTSTAYTTALNAAVSAGESADDVFSGTFDGGGHKIKNLLLPDGDTRCIGLFGQTLDGEIKNVKIELLGGELTLTRKKSAEVDNKDGYQYAGVLAGYARGTKISNVEIKGVDLKITRVDSDQYFYAGALLGAGGYGVEIKNCSSSVNIIESATNTASDFGITIGGLVGLIDRTESDTAYIAIESSHSSGNITITEDISVTAGGLAGFVSYNGGTAGDAGPYAGKVIKSYAIGDVTVISSSVDTGRGGLIGISAAVEECYAEGDVSATGGSVGGLIGTVNSTSGSSPYVIKKSYATGSVTSNGAGNTWAGGLIGKNNANPVEDCFAASTVNVTTSSGYIMTGGLGGLLTGGVKNCYSASQVTAANNGSSYIYLGGIAGSCSLGLDKFYGNAVLSPASLNVTAVTGNIRIYRLIGSAGAVDYSTVNVAYAAMPLGSTLGTTGMSAIGQTANAYKEGRNVDTVDWALFSGNGDGQLNWDTDVWEWDNTNSRPKLK